eukprot:1857024-Heterocapsa_arctica.AAC.2
MHERAERGSETLVRILSRHGDGEEDRPGKLHPPVPPTGARLICAADCMQSEDIYINRYV